MDKTSIIEGQGENSLIVGSMDCQKIQKKQSGSKTWISFIEYISVIEKVLYPLLIFKGKGV